MEYKSIELMNRGKDNPVISSFEKIDNELRILVDRSVKLKNEYNSPKEIRKLGKLIRKLLSEDELESSLQGHEQTLVLERKTKIVKLLYKCIRVAKASPGMNELINSLVDWLSRNNPQFSDLNMKIGLEKKLQGQTRPTPSPRSSQT